MTSIDISQYPETVFAFGGNEQRATVFLDRYALKDATGKPIERIPDEMWSRVATAIADDDLERASFRELLKDWKFVPGGRILAGAGTGTEVTYYNCFVIPVETKARRKARSVEKPEMLTFSKGISAREIGKIRDVINRFALTDSGSDSREAIFDTIGLMVDIMSRGGGVGINWSVLRPKGAHLKRVNGTTSGPVSWMDVASKAVGVVEQGGSRRGAAMFMLDDWHPDVEEFINAKRNFGVITNANVSVAISDEFMEAVKSDGNWELRFPDTTDPRYNSEWDGDLAKWVASGAGVTVFRTVRARDLWRNLAEAAWASGEPGVVFLGRYNERSTGAGVERIISVNPCGEQGLGPYSVCNLGAMNLGAYVVPETKYNATNKYKFDMARFQEDVMVATTFLDNIIDKTHYFIPENEHIQKRLRRIGLGVMGLADALIGLGLRYGSKEAQEFTHKVFQVMKVQAIRQSANLAYQKGSAPAWEDAMAERPYFDDVRESPMFSQVYRHGLRNLFLLTQAPTGTTSLLAGVNSGIEPYFAFEYTRKDRTGTHLMKASVFDKYEKLPDIGQSFMVTSNDVTAEEHVYMQAAAQDQIDSSVSKTINAPYEHTVEQVEMAYTLAYINGCKGIAYFRDGCGRDQVLYKNGVPAVSDEKLKDAEAKVEALEFEIADLYEQIDALAPYGISYQRATVLQGETHRIATKAGTAYVTVNRDQYENKPVEVFFNVGKAGSDLTAMAEALGRVASLALRHGASLGGVANQLEGVGGNGNLQKAIPAAISEALTKANNRKTVKPVEVESPDNDEDDDVIDPNWPQEIVHKAPRADLCPDCGNASLVREEGCNKCQICGYSAC